MEHIITEVAKAFPSTLAGQVRARIFSQIIIACIIPFSSSISSNILRVLRNVFGLEVGQKAFYGFMASRALPWRKIWTLLWKMIPQPETDGRVMVALDDFINPKTGKKVFGCANVFDHAAKGNQSQYPWAQNIVSIGLLKMVKGRWACVPLAFRHYFSKKAFEDYRGDDISTNELGRTKFEHAADMLEELSWHLLNDLNTSMLVVCDSWFGNNGLYRLGIKAIGKNFHILSRLRSNITLYAMPTEGAGKRRGRKRKYGELLGSAADMAKRLIGGMKSYNVFLYGKRRNVNASTMVVMMKTLKCQVRVVWVYRNTRWVALFTTDLSLSVEQIIEYYGARWKIESGFKEIKQDIGSSRAQCRTKGAVRNHLDFCMMAAAVTWIYAMKDNSAPRRRHQVKGRQSFAFSDIRRRIANEVLDENFAPFCHNEGKSPKNMPLTILLKLVA